MKNRWDWTKLSILLQNTTKSDKIVHLTTFSYGNSWKFWEVFGIYWQFLTSGTFIASIITWYSACKITKMGRRYQKGGENQCLR